MDILILFRVLSLCCMLLLPCRYCAQRKKAAESINDWDKFSVVHDSLSEMVQLGLNPSLTENSSEKLVFLCYRGYNHISGKVLRSYI